MVTGWASRDRRAGRRNHGLTAHGWSAADSRDDALGLRRSRFTRRSCGLCEEMHTSHLGSYCTVSYCTVSVDFGWRVHGDQRDRELSPERLRDDEKIVSIAVCVWVSQKTFQPYGFSSAAPPFVAPYGTLRTRHPRMACNHIYHFQGSRTRCVRDDNAAPCP